MTSLLPEARTFDALMEADLERIYRQGKEEVLRDRAFRILLARADRVDKMEKLAFEGEMGLDRWTTKELIEILNHFRLLSSPENIVRLYRQCRDQAFRNAPRVREFYVIALNRLGWPAEAIREASRIIAEGGQNTLLWGTLGEAYSARMMFAESFANAVEGSGSDSSAIPLKLKQQFHHYFPEFGFEEMTLALARSLRQENLASASHIFRRGFRESGSSFTGLGWMLRTIDRLADLIAERGRLEDKNRTKGLDPDEALRLRLAGNEIGAVKEELEHQAILVGVALELQGGGESLDYWTHAGILLVAVLQGLDRASVRAVLARVFATVDADFKFTITMSELGRIRSQWVSMREIEASQGRDVTWLDHRINLAGFAIAELDAGRGRFHEGRGVIGSALDEKYRQEIAGEPDAAATFLKKTVNFRALLGNLVPLHISGGIGRVGSRVPDLVINRQVQEDLTDLVETKICQALTPKEKDHPKTVIARIQQVVGAGLQVGNLQDLQSPAHFLFETHSDGLIALSGIDPDMRKETRTGTDLTATLLMHNGDCRETMYLNGALFACWQHMEVKKRIAQAMLCLELNFLEGFQRIVGIEIPELMRYELRGGQAFVYADSISMRSKYHCERLSETDPTAVMKPYTIDDLRADLPLTDYELWNSILEVTYIDGSSTWLGSKDEFPGNWRPIDHTPAPGGGVPIIKNAGPNYENVKSLRIINLVEEHALTFLYDRRLNSAEFCDGFYNQCLFHSPYQFGSGIVNLGEMRTGTGLISAGVRAVVDPEGLCRERPVYLQFLPFSKTEYEPALAEGDIPGTIHLMGRTFHCDLKRERRRLEEGTSPIPALLEKVQAWQLERQKSRVPDRETAERQLALFILGLAKEKSEFVQIKEVAAGQPLIIEESKSEHIYLVLSGKMYISRHGRLLRDENGVPIVVEAGGILGEISALRAGGATATVEGNGVVLSISKTIIEQQLASNPAFRRIMNEVANYRIF